MQKKTNETHPVGEKPLVYGMYSNFIKSIKHFDNIQTFYRMMASTFLLGSIAAMGFLFSTRNINIPYQNISALLLLCGIGIASLVSLWHLDLIFYERLLVSNFAEALRLERKYVWLPQIHQRMLQEIYSKNRRTNAVYFYTGSITCLLSVTGVLSIYLLKKEGLLTQAAGCIGFLVAILIVNLYLRMKTRKVNFLLQYLKNGSNGF